MKITVVVQQEIGMKELSLESFLSAGKDEELNRYRILSALQFYREDFSRNRLYPGLADLIELDALLESLIAHKEDFQRTLPQQLKKIDLENRNLIYEPIQPLEGDIEHIVGLMVWSLPMIKNIIEEGRKIYDFVDENMSVEHVGILPMYREEGYCFISDNTASLLRVLRYEVSLFTAGEEKFRALKMHPLKSYNWKHIRPSLESLKLQLIREYRDLPTPATFACETDLDFPFAQTILPVAKRKLMARVFA
jgi:hypothetical protein